MNRVAVIGGGFAGMHFAQKLARYGDYDIHVFDSKSRPGYPPNTTGGLAWHWIERFIPHMPETCITARINSVRLVGPGGGSALLTADNPFVRDRMGVVLDEPRTVAWMQRDAEMMHDVTVHRPVRIKDVVEIGPTAYQLHTGDDGRAYGTFDFVILADGWSSPMARKFGITQELADDDRHQGFEYVIKSQQQPVDQIILYLGNKIAPHGYVWDFPAENGEMRRFGIGIPLAEQRKGKHAGEYLNEFAAKYGIDISNPIAREGGTIPTSKITTRPRFGNIIAIGDAAAACDPMTGGGIFPALASAEGAVAEIVRGKGNSGLGWLYDELHLRYRLKRMFYRLSDSTLDRLIKRFNISFTNQELNPITERKRVLWRIIAPISPFIVHDLVVNRGQ